MPKHGSISAFNDEIALKTPFRTQIGSSESVVHSPLRRRPSMAGLGTLLPLLPADVTGSFPRSQLLGGNRSLGWKKLSLGRLRSGKFCAEIYG